MKTRILSLLVLLLVLSLTLAVAQTKEECSSTAAKSCSVTGSKASMTKAGTTEPTVILASTKKADAKTVQGSTKKVECSEADKANCDMTKANCDMTKASMTKANCDMTKASTTKASNGAKMDCCKDQAKSAKAEKKSVPEKSEAKGTN